jgi:hypothetical protein
MGRTSLKHSIPLVAFLMAVALLGLPFVKFLFVATISIVVGAVLLYTCLGFFYAVDRVVNFLYTAR